MKKNPKVTIVIPVYNGKEYLKSAIDSALSQTYRNIEVIVVNDGSKDNSKEIALSYGDKIKYYEKENGGVSTVLNLAIKNMTGDFFSWLSHDDLYYPEKVEYQIKYLEEQTQSNIILYSDYDLIDKKGKIFSQGIKNHQLLERKPEYALLRGDINGITLLIPKEAFEKCGLFDETLRTTQDYELWMRMINKYNFVHIPTILASSRVHQQQQTSINPLVVTEGNKLWIDLIEMPSNTRKEELENSVGNYYFEMSKFLKETPYQEASDYALRKSAEFEKEYCNTCEDIKVSIVIPFYNRKDLLKRAIDSCLQQTHKNIEIVLVNDGSTDEVETVINMYKEKSNIIYHKVKENKGVSNARNIGISKATGQYIALLDSDDEFLPEKVAFQLKEMVNKGYLVSHTSYIRNTETKKEVINTGLLTGIVVPKIIYDCQIATPTIMFKKEFWVKNNFQYDINKAIGEDVCLYLEMFQKCDLLGIEKPLSNVYCSNISSAYDHKKQIIGIETILKYVLNDNKLSKNHKEISKLMILYTNVVAQAEKMTTITDFEDCPKCKLIKQSTSWKLTKPVRGTVKFAKILKNRGIKGTIDTIKNKIKK